LGYDPGYSFLKLEINLLAEELVTAIETQQELNSGLASSINSLNAKIAEDNDTDTPEQVSAGETSQQARAIIEKIQNSKLLSKVTKNSKKLQKKIEELK
jgi:hypothetical protein